jgi:polyhydroxyalkanoate synthesis repressor PhaR
MEETNSARVIKRYTNRKLYDTVESRYVTLDEIASMVKAGEEVQIMDNRTGNDLTEVTLAQILYEEQKKQTTRMPLQLLKEMIRNRGATISDFLHKRVAQPVQSLKEEAERKVDELVRKSESTVEGTARQIKDVFSTFQTGLDEVQKRLDERIHHVAEGSRGKIREQLSSLRKRIEEMENRLGDDND